MPASPPHPQRPRSPEAHREVLALAPDALRRHCDPETLGFHTTAELGPLDGVIGQERALGAIEFALDVDGPGYNVFATGPIGTGRQRTLEARLREAARVRPTPGDIVYLPSFDAPERPLCAQLPPGRGQRLASAVAAFVADARRRIPEAFQSESYQRRRAEALGPLEHEREAVLDEVRAFARTHGVELELTPAGVATLPLVDGKTVTHQQFMLLPDSVQASFFAAREQVLQRVGKVMGRIRDIDARAQQRVDELNREVVLFAVGHLIDDLKSEVGAAAAVGAWLDRVREDVIDNYAHFAGERATQLPAPLAVIAGGEALERRYAVNVFVSHDEASGAPLVVERNPTFHRLFGRIEYEMRLGATVTDHTHIQAGAIHRASGGYLLLRAEELLTRPLLWEKLKEILRSGQAPVENLGEQFMLFPSASLAPEPVAVDVKVVLVGTPTLHQLLYELDEDMRELFRVKVDFDVEMPWGEAQARQYAAFVASQVRAQGLRHFTREAVAMVVEQGSRRAADQGKLSTRLGEMADLVAQASHWAGQVGAEAVGAEHVERAIAERTRRSNLLEEKIDEAIAEDTLHIEVTGARVAQVNGLAVSEIGEYAFGHPVRITASAAPGQGRVVSVERETKLSGPVHDKGFLTLRGFLEQRYGRRVPLSLSASLTFEQSYGTIDGDSAASAELCALVSCLAEAPADQQIALTGSVDQHGRIQAVGAVTEKIEGFFKACERAGLTGEQGVIIPRPNARNLMLGPEVIGAVREGRFHIWAVRSIDEALELLTGVPAGERGPDGAYPAGTLHRRVENRLAEMAGMIRALMMPSPNGAEPAGREATSPGAMAIRRPSRSRAS
jgi:lon-related putative ATP-dependent protease